MTCPSCGGIHLKRGNENLWCDDCGYFPIPYLKEVVMQNEVTEKHTGTTHNTSWDSERYGDVRHRAFNDYVERKTKARKDKKVKVPDYHPGQIVVVLAEAYQGGVREYLLYEIVDFQEEYKNFVYFGILLKTTDKKSLGRLGIIGVVNDKEWFRFKKVILQVYNEKENKIKWLQEGEDAS